MRALPPITSSGYDPAAFTGVPDELPTATSLGHASSTAPTATAPVDASPSSVPTCTSLSPDALMAYCEARLQSLDSQMNDIFVSQQKNATVTTDVNAIAAALNDLPAPSSGSSTTTTVAASQNQQIVQAYQTAINDAGGKDTALGQSLTQDQLSFENGIGSNGTVSTSLVSQLSQNLKNDAADLNSDSEMTMINLQSLMSQRQTAVQLTTNLVQSLGDQQSSIAKNIGQ